MQTLQLHSQHEFAHAEEASRQWQVGKPTMCSKDTGSALLQIAARKLAFRG